MRAVDRSGDERRPAAPASGTPASPAPPICRPPPPPAGQKLVFVVTEDWFFASHFLPMARAARELGLEVAVSRGCAPPRGHRGHRRARDPARSRAAQPQPPGGRLCRRPARGDPQGRSADLVHCIALRAILVGGSRRRWPGVRAAGLRPDGPRLPRRPPGPRRARLARRRPPPRARPRDARRPATSSRTRTIRALGLDPADARARHDRRRRRRRSRAPAPAPLPPQPPLKVAVVARMLWSKGIDLAVEAVRRAAPGRRSSCRSTAHPTRRIRRPSGGDAAGLEPRSRASPGTADRRRRRRLARASRLLPALARRRGPAAHPARRRGLRARARHDRRARLPRLVRDGIEGLSCRRTTPRRWPRPSDARRRSGARRPHGRGARARMLDGFTERDVMDAVKRSMPRMLARAA